MVACFWFALLALVVLNLGLFVVNLLCLLCLFCFCFDVVGGCLRLLVSLVVLGLFGLG